MRKTLLAALILASAACGSSSSEKPAAKPGSPAKVSSDPKVVAKSSQLNPTNSGKLDSLLLEDGLLNAPAVRQYIQQVFDLQKKTGISDDSVVTLKIAFITQWAQQHPDSAALLKRAMEPKK
jgi:hypothetical protein